MYKLGITGGMGSGKSTATLFFKQKGAEIFDADKEAKNHLLKTIYLQHLVIRAFGSQVTTDNQLDLIKLSNFVFSSKKYQKKLNEIVWPEVSLLISNTAVRAEREGKKLFVVDAALLFEAGYTDSFNSILLITAHQSIRTKRILLRNSIPKSQIEKRMALQMPESEKQELAQTTIENNGNIQDLYLKLEQFHYKSPSI